MVHMHLLQSYGFMSDQHLVNGLPLPAILTTGLLELL